MKPDITGRDISGRQWTDERFRLIVEAAPNAIVMVNAEGNIVLVNTQTEETFGYERGDLLGRSVEMLVPKRFRAAHVAARLSYCGCPQARPMGAGRDLYGVRKDGSEFPVEIGLNPIRTKEGVLVLGAIVDISARKRAEQALRDGKEELERALVQLHDKNEEARTMTQQLWQAAKLASVGELAAGIAHELNNPLATVSLRIESTLARTPVDDPRRRALEIIDQEVHRMAALVSSLLQFSRKGEEKISTVNICEELRNAVDLIQHQLRKVQVTVIQELAADTPIAYADRQKLRQVFLNLLTNASDAMPGGGTLILRTAAARLDDGQPAVLIEFIDTGVGIPPEHLEAVMEPFFTTKEEGKGTGLGLAICKRVIQEHRGVIQILSKLGVGTTVRILLPIQSGGNVAPLRKAGRRM